MPSAMGAAQIAIYSRLKTAWADATPIQWPGATFTPPNKSPWLGVEVLWGDGFELSMASTNGNRAVGVIHVRVYGPRAEGRGSIMVKADAVRDVFNRVAFSGVRCGVPSGPKAVDDPEWEVVAVTVPFTIEETT